MSEVEPIIRYIWEKHCGGDEDERITPEVLVDCLVEMFERDLILDKGAEELIGQQMRKRHGQKIPFELKFHEMIDG
jgi:hypothetical protein